MLKFTQFQGCILESVLVDDRAYANMQKILNSIIQDAWSDYEQVLNSSEDLIEDLGLVHVSTDFGVEACGWHIPVDSVSNWLYTIKVKDCHKDIQSKFRTYRRRCEDSLRVTWGMPAGELIFTDIEWEYLGRDTKTELQDLAMIFEQFGVPRDIIKGGYSNGGVYEMLQEIASSKYCGEAGRKLHDMLESIDNLPLGDRIIDYIEEHLPAYVPEMATKSNIDDFLDKINVTISFLSSKFFGGTNAK